MRSRGTLEGVARHRYRIAACRLHVRAAIRVFWLGCHRLPLGLLAGFVNEVSDNLRDGNAFLIGGLPNPLNAIGPERHTEHYGFGLYGPGDLCLCLFHAV